MNILELTPCLSLVVVSYLQTVVLDYKVKSVLRWSPEPYLLPVFQDSELLDKRRQCFSVQMDTGEDTVFSVELESDLGLWEKAFQMATFLEVERIQVNASPFTTSVQPVRTTRLSIVPKEKKPKQKTDPCSF